MNVRVACVGAGYFSQFHYDSWARMERISLVGSCDHTLEKAQATGLPAYDDLDQMLKDVSPDLLDIILPPVAHAETIKAALAAGVKTIICQKPFCKNLAEAEEMTALAETSGARIIVHENFRFQPWYRAIKAAIEERAVGTVQQVSFRLRPGDGQGADAYLDRQPYFQQMEKFLIHETGVHYIDTFRYLLGDPTAVYADLRKVNPVIAGEDAGYVVFDHPNGARAMLDGNRHLDHAADNLRCTMGEGLIEGTEGTLTLTGDGAVQLRKHSTTSMTTVLGPNTKQGFGGDCVHSLQSHVICGILDGTKLENEARVYLQVIRIEEAIYASAEKAQKLKV
jgi:predicted dehydrogenase